MKLITRRLGIAVGDFILSFLFSKTVTSTHHTESMTSTPPKIVTVRAFGARLLGGVDAEEHASSVFRGMNHLWNKLVEIEHAARATYRDALLQSDTELAALQAESDAQQLLIETLYEARNKDRAKARTKKTDAAPSFAVLIKDANGKLKDLRLRMKDIKSRAKEAAMPLIEAAEVQRRQQVMDAVTAADLWWCHSETILAKFDVARVKAMKEGRELRFHRYDGNGSLAVRFSTAGGDLKKVYANKTSLLSFRDPTPEELGRMAATKGDGGVRKIIEMRAGNKSDDKAIPVLTFLVTMHNGRDFPADTPLKTVSATRTIHVNKGEWKLVFTFSRASTGDEPLPDLPSKAVGIDFGFRLVKDDDGQKVLRVGTLNFGDQVHYVTLGQDWLRRMERADRLRSQLDDASNVFQAQIKPYLTDEALAGLAEDEWFKILCGKVKRAKAAYAALLMDLCIAHERAGQPLGDAVSTLMKDFHKEALSQAVQTHHCRRKAVDHRKHVYRNVAARLVREAGLIAMVDTNFHKVAATTSPEGEDTELALTARRNRTWAAPSELRLAIAQAAKREKAELISVPAAKNSGTCSDCGHEHTEKMVDLMFVCQGCSKVWDQDVNASANARNFGMKNRESAVYTMG